MGPLAYYNRLLMDSITLTSNKSAAVFNTVEGENSEYPCNAYKRATGSRESRKTMWLST